LSSQFWDCVIARATIRCHGRADADWLMLTDARGDRKLAFQRVSDSGQENTDPADHLFFCIFVP
jgi:hypothetical protein